MVLLVWLFILTSPPARDVDPMEAVRAALATSDQQLASELLAGIEETAPHLFELNNLPYLKAHLLLQQGRREDARQVLRKLDWRNSLLGDSILITLLETEEDLAPTEWKAHLAAFLENYRTHPSWASWALRYALRLKQEGDAQGALDWFNRLWKAKAGIYSRKGALEHARMHIVKGEPGEAVTDLHNLIKKDENDDVALRAALDLEELQPQATASEADLRRRARVLMNNRRTKTARNHLEYLTAAFPKSLSVPQYRYLIARSYVFDGNLSKAYQGYQECYARDPASDWGIFCHYQAGNTALRRLDYAEAVKDYADFISAHPANRRTGRVRFNLADTYRWLNQDEEAEKMALQGLRESRGTELYQFHYYLARLYFEQKRYSEAWQHLSKLDDLSSRQLPSGVTREEVLYFLGECLLKLNRPEEALGVFRAGGSGQPNYFGFLCRSRLPVWPEKDRTAEAWTLRPLTPRSFRWEPDVAATTDELAEIRELLFLGLVSQAALKIKEVGKKPFSSNDEYLFNLAYYADGGGLPRDSLLAADKLARARFPGAWPNELPEPLRSLLYPRHYWELAKRSGQEQGVDPHLLMAVIYQESHFDPNAKSVASARGLMQFLSSSATQLAQEMKLPTPRPEDLYRPDLSIQLGGYYLKKLLRRHENSVAMALAAYNGGSQNVERWSAKGNQQTPQEFIANIGFRETKLYVLKVMGHYLAYQQIYREPVEHTLTAAE